MTDVMAEVEALVARAEGEEEPLATLFEALELLGGALEGGVELERDRLVRLAIRCGHRARHEKVRRFGRVVTAIDDVLERVEE